MRMIVFIDKDIQKAFNNCRFRIQLVGVDICRGMCQPCSITMENSQCRMLIEHFSKKEGDNDEDDQDAGNI